jgi:prepilin-type N-terminal cleavage/methylation domain-containing protein
MRGKSKRSGFTLIEVLVVMAIISILIVGIIVGVGGMRKRAMGEKTKALLNRISVALGSYHAQFRSYPADGYDRPLFVMYGRNRQRVKGSTALVYFLCRPLTKLYRIGADGEIRRQTVGPFLELKKDELSGDAARTIDERLDDPRTEILDAWGHPIHYDNLERELHFRANDLTDINYAHSMPGLVQGIDHWKDPRTQGGGVKAMNDGTYDLFSHGAIVAPSNPNDPRELRRALDDDITNWKN